MSLSMPNTWRTDTFMSGSPATSSVAIVIAPPWPRSRVEPAFERESRLRCGANLAESPRGAHPPSASAKADGFQVVVRLDDLAQPVLAAPVAAVGIGVMPLHQQLEPSLDVGSLGVTFQPQRIERLALRVADRPVLAWLFRAWGCPAAELREHAERIGGPIERGEPSGTCTRLTGLLAVLAQLPGRPMAGHGILLEPCHRIIAHPGEIIVGMVVLAHVFEAEAPILALAQPSLGGAVRGRAVAARPSAGRTVGAAPPVLARLDPDAVEKGRVELHNRSLCALRRAGCKLPGGR